MITFKPLDGVSNYITASHCQNTGCRGSLSLMHTLDIQIYAHTNRYTGYLHTHTNGRTHLAFFSKPLLVEATCREELLFISGVCLALWLVSIEQQHSS